MTHTALDTKSLLRSERKRLQGLDTCFQAKHTLSKRWLAKGGEGRNVPIKHFPTVPPAETSNFPALSSPSDYISIKPFKAKSTLARRAENAIRSKAAKPKWRNPIARKRRAGKYPLKEGQPRAFHVKGPLKCNNSLVARRSLCQAVCFGMGDIRMWLRP